MDYGFFSILPIVVVLVIAFIKRNVFVALMMGLVVSSIIVGMGTHDFLVGFRLLSEVFSLPSTAQVIFFLFLTGAIMHCANRSGGVEGLVKYCTEKRKVVSSKMGAELFTMVLGLLLFIDALSSIIITSCVGKPFFKKYGLPDEKLALISNSTGAAITWLIPFSGAGAMMTSFLAPIVKDLELDITPFYLLMTSVGYQFYTIALFVILIIVILTRNDLGPMKELMKEKKHHYEHTDYEFATEIPEGKVAKAICLVMPVLLLVILAFGITIYTGKGSLMQGNVTLAMFSSGIITLIFSGVMYVGMHIVKTERYIEWAFEGMHPMFEVILIFVMAYAFGAMLHLLDTAGYMAHYAMMFPSGMTMLAVLLFTSCVAYATGSSSATVALLFPIFVPLAYRVGIPLPYIIGGMISGAIFGDQNSPISDSVILTSRMTGVNIISHVKTQIPYTGMALLIAFVGYALLSMTV